MKKEFKMTAGWHGDGDTADEQQAAAAAAAAAAGAAATAESKQMTTPTLSSLNPTAISARRTAISDRLTAISDRLTANLMQLTFRVLLEMKKESYGCSQSNPLIHIYRKLYLQSLSNHTSFKLMLFANTSM